MAGRGVSKFHTLCQLIRNRLRDSSMQMVYQLYPMEPLQFCSEGNAGSRGWVNGVLGCLFPLLTRAALLLFGLFVYIPAYDFFFFLENGKATKNLWKPSIQTKLSYIYSNTFIFLKKIPLWLNKLEEKLFKGN